MYRIKVIESSLKRTLFTKCTITIYTTMTVYLFLVHIYWGNKVFSIKT